MRKVILSISILLGLSLVSCDRSEVTQGTSSSSSDNLAQKQSTIISGVESISIDNGLGNTGCTNNILIFPTWTSYWATIDQLDQLTENYCNNFDATIPVGITNDQYDVLCTNAGFDEDNMLLKFENDLEFCSLRQKLIQDENNWVDSQGAGSWNASTDPDNDFIDDDTERALLSVGHEVIIGNRKAGYVIYKLTDDNGGYIEIHNMDLVALQQINHGLIPTNNPNVIVYTPPKKELINTATCKNTVKDIQYIPNIDNSTRIKIKSKIRGDSSWSRSKISSSTKGYVRKNGRWKVKRTWITAGITDEIGTNNSYIYNNCTTQFNIYKLKEKRRRKVKVKEAGSMLNGADLNIAVHDNKIYSYHKQGSIDIKHDYYDMPVN